jgi:hypothetical protein
MQASYDKWLVAGVMLHADMCAQIKSGIAYQDKNPRPEPETPPATEAATNRTISMSGARQPLPATYQVHLSIQIASEVQNTGLGSFFAQSHLSDLRGGSYVPSTYFIECEPTED